MPRLNYNFIEIKHHSVSRSEIHSLTRARATRDQISDRMNERRVPSDSHCTSSNEGEQEKGAIIL